MPRLPRMWTRPNVLVEVVNRTFQGRHLIKPSPHLNAIIIGALAKIGRKHAVKIHGGAFASNHFHLCLSAGSLRDQAAFMRDFTRKLSFESGIVHDWEGSTFPDRYRSTEISEEPEAQIDRLTYWLKHGCKEGLVASPLDWPAVSFAEALTTGEPLKGIWIDRSGFYRAKRRGKDVSLEDFTEHLELLPAPLPCWREEGQELRQAWVKDIILGIERETTLLHAENGTTPLGAEDLVAGNPHYRPPALRRKPKPFVPKPLVHAFSRRVRQEMRDALVWISSSYREAAARLKVGDLAVTFPENTFPPHLPFVEPLPTSHGPNTLSPVPG